MKKIILTVFLTTLFFCFAPKVSAQSSLTTDTRQLLPVADPAVVRIGNDFSFGTGTYIAPNKILTAAHVVKQFGNDFDIYEAQHGSYSPIPIKPLRVDTHPLHKSGALDASRYDLAVITVDKQSRFYYPYRLVYPTTVPVYEDRYRWFGYPFDLNYTDSDQPLSYNQYGDEGTPVTFLNSGHVLTFNNTSAQGQSGSGLISDYSRGVIGTLNGGADDTIFTLLTKNNYEFVRSNVLN